ncbi:MAG: hypothetical protein KDA99_21035, partial [Planctomycetales bacterium]|nr:hypothetical protein [Planctomycetales bacterium]
MGSPVEILCSEFGQRLGQSSLQEIVACLGEPAAGLPNQYVLEKAFAAADLDLRYLTFEVSSGGLADALRGARALGLLGLQLEAPHQSTAVELIDKLTDVANYVGAVDLVTRDGDQLRGDHSVGKAVSQCLAQQKANLRSKFVVFGTGAAARSVVFESAMSGATEIVVVGRDRGRGRQLID